MKKLIGLLLLGALISGCDDESVHIASEADSVSDAGFTAATLESLQGNWLSSDSNEDQDIYFIEIEPDGVIYNFDYLGDTADDGPTCYQLNGYDDANQISLTELGNSRFLMTTNYNGEWVSSYLTAMVSDDGDELTLTYQDIFDVDFDGNTNEFQTILLSHVDNDNIEYFRPECSDSSPLSPETNNQAPSPSIVTLPNGFNFETSQEILQLSIEGDWDLIWKSEQSLSLDNQQNLSGDDIYGSMFINNGLVTMVSDEYPSISGGRHVVSFSYEFDTLYDGQESQWLDAVRIDGCEQRVQISIAEDWSLMAMGFRTSSCDHDVQTVYVWEHEW